MSLQHTPEFIASFEQAAHDLAVFLSEGHMGRFHFDLDQAINETKKQLVADGLDKGHAEPGKTLRDVIDWLKNRHNATGKVVFSHPAFATKIEGLRFDNVMRGLACDELRYAQKQARSLSKYFNAPHEFSDDQKAVVTAAAQSTTDGNIAFYMAHRSKLESRMIKKAAQYEGNADDFLMIATWLKEYLSQKIAGKTDAEILPLKIELPSDEYAEILKAFMQSANGEPVTYTGPAPAPGL